MALLWIEGFEGFGTSGAPSGLERKYSDVNSTRMSIVAGRVAGFAIRAGSIPLPRIQTPNLGDIGIWIIGFGCATGSLQKR